MRPKRSKIVCTLLMLPSNANEFAHIHSDHLVCALLANCIKTHVRYNWLFIREPTRNGENVYSLCLGRQRKIQGTSSTIRCLWLRLCCRCCRCLCCASPEKLIKFNLKNTLNSWYLHNTMDCSCSFVYFHILGIVFTGAKKCLVWQPHNQLNSDVNIPILISQNFTLMLNFKFDVDILHCSAFSIAPNIKYPIQIACN